MAQAPAISNLSHSGLQALLESAGTNPADNALVAFGQFPSVHFARFFILPGVYHCRGGPGADDFDSIDAMDKWVEQGQAPTRIVASQTRSGGVVRTRPLCPYPQVATYKGSGDPNAADSFRARAGRETGN